jgi:hypothetical protein
MSSKEVAALRHVLNTTPSNSVPRQLPAAQQDHLLKSTAPFQSRDACAGGCLLVPPAALRVPPVKLHGTWRSSKPIHGPHLSVIKPPAGLCVSMAHSEHTAAVDAAYLTINRTAMPAQKM